MRFLATMVALLLALLLTKYVGFVAALAGALLILARAIASGRL